jgi:hypothetical protein
VTKDVDELENRCRVIKNNLMAEERNRTHLKGELIQQQKVMSNAGMRVGEL